MKNSYIQDLTAGALLVEETLCWLRIYERHQAVSLDDLLDALPSRSETTLKRYDALIKKRLQPVSSESLFKIANLNGEPLKQILLLLIMARTQMVSDFIKEVWCDARRSYQPVLTLGQIQRFIDEKTNQQTDLQKTSDNSMIKVRTNMIKILVDTGMLENNKTFRLQNLFLLPEVYQIAETEGLQSIVQVLECSA